LVHVLVGVTMKDTVSWQLTLITLKEMHQCVGGIYIIHVEGG